jgi:hypothetical protein
MIRIVANYDWNRNAEELLGSEPLRMPADFIAVCLWAITGLVATALVAAFDSSADIASFLAAAG